MGKEKAKKKGGCSSHLLIKHPHQKKVISILQNMYFIYKLYIHSVYLMSILNNIISEMLFTFLDKNQANTFILHFGDHWGRV